MISGTNIDEIKEVFKLRCLPLLRAIVLTGEIDKELQLIIH